VRRCAPHAPHAPHRPAPPRTAPHRRVVDAPHRAAPHRTALHCFLPLRRCRVRCGCHVAVSFRLLDALCCAVLWPVTCAVLCCAVLWPVTCDMCCAVACAVLCCALCCVSVHRAATHQSVRSLCRVSCVVSRVSRSAVRRVAGQSDEWSRCMIVDCAATFFCRVSCVAIGCAPRRCRCQSVHVLSAVCRAATFSNRTIGIGACRLRCDFLSCVVCRDWQCVRCVATRLSLPIGACAVSGTLCCDSRVSCVVCRVSCVVCRVSCVVVGCAPRRRPIGRIGACGVPRRR
jgi:hypothetical protein